MPVTIKMVPLYCLLLIFTSTTGINICVVQQQGIRNDEIVQDTVRNVSDTFNMTSSVSIVTLSTLEFSSSSLTDCDIFNETCAGLVTFADCAHALHVDEWAKRQLIPHVIITSRSCDLKITHGVRMESDYTIANKMITDVVKQELWHDAVIINDESFDKRQMADLINRLSDNFVATTVLRMSDRNQSITETLHRLANSSFRCVVVLATDPTVQEIFLQASEQGMLGQKYFWLLMSDSLSLPTLTTLLVARSNVILTRSRGVPGTWDTCDKDEPGECNLLNSTQLDLLKINAAFRILFTSFQGSSEFINFNQSESSCGNNSQVIDTRRSMIHNIKEGLFYGLSRQYEFDNEGYPHDVGYNIYSTCDRYKQWFLQVGSWTSGAGLVSTGELYRNTFSSFDNVTLLLGSQEAIPFVVKNVENNRTFFTGFCVDMLDELALRFNFHYRIVEPPDRIWGAPVDQEGKEWNGIVGMVLRKELAFGIGPFTITSIRESAIDFTKPYMEEGIGIITRRPDGESQKMFKMYTPFAPVVWGCIVVAVVVVGILLYLVNRYSPYAAHRQLIKVSGEPLLEMMSLKSSMWLIYGSYMEQGGDPHPNSISGRCILGFWWLFTILMASTYTANLAAFLTVTIAEKPINSLAELAGQEEIKPLVKYGSNLYSLFKDADGGVYQDIWENMQGFPVVKNNSEALQYVVTGSMAYMTDRSQLEYIMLHDCETYSLADEIFNTAGLGFIVPEDAPYLDAFNYNIMKMQEAGLIDKWKQKWWPSSDKCTGSDRTSSATVLGLDSLAGPFLIYAIVTAVAFLCLVLEYGFYTSKLNILCQKLKLFRSSGSQKTDSSSAEVKT